MKFIVTPSHVFIYYVYFCKICIMITRACSEIIWEIRKMVQKVKIKSFCLEIIWVVRVLRNVDVFESLTGLFIEFETETDPVLQHLRGFSCVVNILNCFWNQHIVRYFSIDYIVDDGLVRKLLKDLTARAQYLWRKHLQNIKLPNLRPLFSEIFIIDL